MKKYKFKIIIVVLIFGAIASSYYSYLLGVTSAHEASIASKIPIVQKQYECIKSSDQKCVEMTNDILLKYLHISARSLLSNGLGIDKKIKNEIIDFDLWYKRHEKNKN